ncbi:diguanylate cyclase [Desulfobulbus rhabdoformis]|uniref:diguanylate cyclase domain-containing protein n=1 Tax=Desulfobulbus rhabdoformis TaxID=34032 RepID=UPI0019635424|nr:diguanylate cyclase [Desulfobulbus rhabdoformis]
MIFHRLLRHHLVFISLSLLSVLVVCLSTAFILDHQRRSTIDEGLKQSAYHARNFEEQLTRNLDSIQRLADFIAAVTPEEHGERANVLFSRLLRQNPFLRSLSTIDQQGRILNSSNKQAIGRRVELIDFYPQPHGTQETALRIGRPWLGRDVDQGVPIDNGQQVSLRSLGFVPLLVRGQYNGEPVLVLAALNPDYFINYYTQWLDTGIGLAEVIRYDRLPLFTSGEFLSGTPDAARDLGSRLQSSEIGQYRSTQSQHGPMLTAYRASRRFPLLVVIHLSQEQVLAKWRQESVQTVILVGMTLMVLLYLASTLHRRQQRLASRREAQRRREYEQLAATVFETVLEAVMVTDREQNILTVNPAFTRITGYAKEESVGADLSLLASGYQPEDFSQKIENLLTGQGHWEGEVRSRRKSGEIFVAWFSITQVLGDQGQVLYLVSGFSDITEYCAEADRISHLAHHDLLTGLPNRALLKDRLRQGVRQAHRERTILALLFFDLDRFKPVNDNLGHLVGDLLLQTLSSRLQEILRVSDTLARLGGDEFVLVLPNIKNSEDAFKVAEKIRSTVAIPFTLEGHYIEISASIGVALFPDHGVDELSLMRCGDQAMYQAKAAGGNRYAIYEQQMS